MHIMDESSAPPILAGTSSGILTLQFNRPEKKNAIRVDMYGALNSAMRKAADNPEVRCVLFTGSPTVFTSGNDLMDFAGRPSTDGDHPVVQFLHLLVDFPKPMVAAVNGLAIGIGVTMLPHCDLVYAGEGTRFQTPFVNLGLCPEAGSSFLLPMLSGYHHAAQAILLGKPFTATQAEQWGIVNQICPKGETDVTALAAARQLAAQPPASMRVSRDLLRAPFREQIKDAIRRENAAFMERLASPEVAEAFQAFMQRRPPDFSSFS